MAIIDTIKSVFTPHTIPQGLHAVENFNVKRFMGAWYEVARINYKHEKNVNNTTANYSLNSDHSIKVINQGFNYKTDTHKKTEGKALFVREKNLGMLKVSFGLFYSGYNIIAIYDAYTPCPGMGQQPRQPVVTVPPA